MGEIVRLRGHSNAAARPSAASPEARRHRLLIGALVAVITLALGAVVYTSWPRTPANIVGRPASPEVSDDSAVFGSQANEERQRARQAEQEKEDSAVFGQAPSAPAYQTTSR